MKTRKLFTVLIILVGILMSQACAQKVWDLRRPNSQDYINVGSDTSISHLEELILMKNSDPFKYGSAALWLSYYHDETEKQFLLENLHTKINEGNYFGANCGGVSAIDSLWQWWKYFEDQYIRGYLGDQSAIAGMDTVVRFFPDKKNYRRLRAIEYLAEASHYDYYDILKSEYPNEYSAFGIYGKDARYRDEVRAFLENTLRANATNRRIREESADAISLFDKPYAIGVLTDIYHNFSGDDRYFLFIQLNLMDPDGAPERTVEAVRKEPDGMERSNYFPVPGEVEKGMITKRYYEPWFIKFTREWLNKDTSEVVQYFVGWWLNDFIPLKTDSTLPFSTQIDNLIKLKDTMVNYQWIGMDNYNDELTEYLQDARKYCNLNDLINCARELFKLKQRIVAEFRDTLNVTPNFITDEGVKFLYFNAKYLLNSLPQIPPDPVINSISPPNIYSGSNAFTLTINGKNFVTGSTAYWNNTAKSTTFIADSIIQASISASDISVIDSPLVMVKNPDDGESSSIRFYVKQAPIISGCNVKLINSIGTKLTGGTLQYYEGSWKDAVNNNDGTFFVNTTKTLLSLRMIYEYGTQTKSNVSIGSDTIAFQTVNAQIQLQNSDGILIDTGAVKYYAGAWRDLGTTVNGIASKELLPNNYSFRMTYEYASKDQKQDLSENPTVVFQTVNAAVQLQNSQGTLMPAPSGDQGTVQYYSGAWREFGTTTNGGANKELLPNNYSFRMTYAYASKDQKQDLNENPTVVFQTVNAAVQLQNSQGTLMPAPSGDEGVVKYYSGAWREFGTTTNGVANKELLPNNYSFRMTYEYANKDKKQDLSENPTVVFQTVNAAVQLQNSQGSLIDQGTVQYYSGAWREFGTTTNGVANKELLPNNYSFRMTYEYASKDKKQDLSVNPTVVFQTVNATVQLQNSQGALMPAPLGDQSTVQYYSGAWRDLGTTVNGIASKELLSNNYSFRMTYAYASKDKKQNIGADPIVIFQTVNAAVQLQNSQGNLMPAPSGDQGTVQYYSGAWRSLGTTTNGIASKELLPNNYSFRMTYEYASIDKKQDISSNNIVDFSTVLCTIRVKNTQNQPIDGATASYYSGAWRQIGITANGEVTKELLPLNLSFRVKLGTQQQDKKQNISTNNIVEFTVE